MDEDLGKSNWEEMIETEPRRLPDEEIIASGSKYEASHSPLEPGRWDKRSPCNEQWSTHTYGLVVVGRVQSIKVQLTSCSLTS